MRLCAVSKDCGPLPDQTPLGLTAFSSHWSDRISACTTRANTMPSGQACEGPLGFEKDSSEVSAAVPTSCRDSRPAQSKLDSSGAQTELNPTCLVLRAAQSPKCATSSPKCEKGLDWVPSNLRGTWVWDTRGKLNVTLPQTSHRDSGQVPSMECSQHLGVRRHGTSISQCSTQLGAESEGTPVRCSQC